VKKVIWSGPVVTSNGDESNYEVEARGQSAGRYNDLVVYKVVDGRHRVAVDDSTAYTVLVVALCDHVIPEPENAVLRQLDFNFTVQVDGTGSVRLSSEQTAGEALKEVESSIKEAQRHVARDVGFTSPVKLSINSSTRSVKVGGQLKVAADLEKQLAGKR
jgi:hypothetical protein